MTTGVLIGYVARPDGSQATFSLAFLSMSIFGGLRYPVENMPSIMSEIANAFPSYHVDTARA